MKEICRKCGIFYPFQTHDYRHTVATIFYQNGVSIQAVRDYLGHKTEDMTKQYLDIIPMQMEKKNEAYFKGRKENMRERIYERELQCYKTAAAPEKMADGPVRIGILILLDFQRKVSGMR